ncbi:MAG: PD-(D/E)XK nuclease family protein [Nitrospiraceae bacterium]|nr:PD-(D/E)XK nuclease family protein [Nitrospiraceae bacterium]
MLESYSKNVRVFHVPFNYRGFTEKLLKQAITGIKNKDYSGILYLAPTHNKISESLKVFHSLVGGAYIPPEMMTIKNLAKKLYLLYGNKNIISKPIIPVIISSLTGQSIGFASMVSNFIDEIKQYRPGKDLGEIQNELINIFSKLNIPEEVSKRAINAITILKKYQKALLENNLKDENDLLVECPELISTYKYRHKTLIIDHFYEITPVEKLILKNLIENSEETVIAIPSEDNFTSITGTLNNFLINNFKSDLETLQTEKSSRNVVFHPFPGIDEEVEGIARNIKNIYISGKYKMLDKITVAFPKLSPYYSIVQRTFKRYGIPCTFLLSKPTGNTKPFLDLFAMLESIEDDYPRLYFSQFLTSPYFKKIPLSFKEWLPRISLNSGLIKGKNSWLNLKNLCDSRYDNDMQIPSEFEQELKHIFNKLIPLESIKKSGTYSEISNALMNIVDNLEFSFEDHGIKEQLSNVLKEFSLMDAFPQNCTNETGLRRFIEDLRYILNMSEIQTEGSGVHVTELFDLRSSSPEYLYIGGLKDGDIPSMPDIDHILPDSARKELGFVDMKRYLYSQKFIFHRLLEASVNLSLSYPAMEGDKFFLPSPFLPWKAEVIESIPGILNKEEELLYKGRTPLSNFIKEIHTVKNRLLDKYFSETSFISVTSIDQYRTCPRKFFVEKLLGLEPLEAKEYEIEGLLLGIIIHQIMEKLISKSFKDYEELKKNAEIIIEELLKNQLLDQYWKNFVKDSFISLLPEIYEIESKLAKEGYSFMRAEPKVEGEVLSGIKLRGKIDRIDKKADSVELIDYKTGSVQLNRSEIINKGATLQLFLYAALMKSLGFKINRVGLYSLKDTKITWIPGKTDIKEGRILEDYIKIGLQYLEKTVLQMRKGDFTANPLNEQTCRMCSEKPYCPYIQTS